MTKILGKEASATMNFSALENVNFFNKIPSTFTKREKRKIGVLQSTKVSKVGF